MQQGKTLTVLIEAENRAKGIVEKAEKEAKELRERTERESREVIEEARKQEGQENQQALAESRKQVQALRKDILDRAEREALDCEKRFQQNRERTLEFIIKAATYFGSDSKKQSG